MDINQEKDKEFDKALRPLKFSDFFGQESIIKNLKVLGCNIIVFFKIKFINYFPAHFNIIKRFGFPRFFLT